MESIANQPEASGWFSANVKEYATIVKIHREQAGIKPGMTAEVEILVAHLQDVLTLPVATVVEQRGAFYCWVKTPQGAERRPLVLGLSNDKFVEVKDGVAAGEEVVLNPRTVVAEAREEEYEEGTVNVEKEFGASSEVEKKSPGRESGPSRPDAPGAERPRPGPAAPGTENRQGPGSAAAGSPRDGDRGGSVRGGASGNGATGPGR